jgi:hypothetical protein
VPAGIEEHKFKLDSQIKYLKQFQKEFTFLGKDVKHKKGSNIGI